MGNGTILPLGQRVTGRSGFHDCLSMVYFVLACDTALARGRAGWLVAVVAEAEGERAAFKCSGKGRRDRSEQGGEGVHGDREQTLHGPQRYIRSIPEGTRLGSVVIGARF